MHCNNRTDASSAVIDTARDLSGGGRLVQLHVIYKGANTKWPRRDASTTPKVDETNKHARTISAGVHERS